GDLHEQRPRVGGTVAGHAPGRRDLRRGRGLGVRRRSQARAAHLRDHPRAARHLARGDAVHRRRRDQLRGRARARDAGDPLPIDRAGHRGDRGGAALVSPASVQAILGIARNAFVSLDTEGRVREWNNRAVELFGYSRSEALGSDLAELIVPPRYREKHQAGLRRAAEAPAPLHRSLFVEAVRRDGAELPVEVTITSVPEADGLAFHAWIEDVSERTELLGALEAQLRGRDPGFGEILDALAEAVTIRDSHDHILYANRAALRQMGFSSLADMQRTPPQAIF